MLQIITITRLIQDEYMQSRWFLLYNLSYCPTAVAHENALTIRVSHIRLSGDFNPLEAEWYCSDMKFVQRKMHYVTTTDDLPEWTVCEQTLTSHTDV